jgi:hypothetical protein
MMPWVLSFAKFLNNVFAGNVLDNMARGYAHLLMNNFSSLDLF